MRCMPQQRHIIGTRRHQRMLCNIPLAVSPVLTRLGYLSFKPQRLHGLVLTVILEIFFFLFASRDLLYLCGIADYVSRALLSFGALSHLISAYRILLSSAVARTEADILSSRSQFATWALNCFHNQPEPNLQCRGKVLLASLDLLLAAKHSRDVRTMLSRVKRARFQTETLPN